MTRYLIPFPLFIKTFKILLESEIWIECENAESAKNPRMRIRGLIRLFLSDSERESECECSPKIRRIAIPILNTGHYFKRWEEVKCLISKFTVELFKFNQMTFRWSSIAKYQDCWVGRTGFLWRVLPNIYVNLSDFKFYLFISSL